MKPFEKLGEILKSGKQPTTPPPKGKKPPKVSKGFGERMQGGPIFTPGPGPKKK